MRLQPVQGKFLQTTVDGRTVNVWLLDPSDGKQGTDVAYADAVRILAYRHPVAVPVPKKGKDGKFVDPLDDADKAAIAKAAEAPGAVPNAGTDSALVDLVKAQGKLIERLEADVAALRKKAK